VATRLFFHAASSPYSNLPTTEQSSLTATNNVDAQTVNRSMDPVKGVLQSTLTFLTSAGSKTVYYTKFVSPTINTTATGTTISANTWEYAFTANQAVTTLNFPVNGTLQPVWVNCYVWDTSSGIKVGTILDGNSNSDFDEAGSGTNNFIRGTFAGSAVSSVTNTCVIIMEIWFQIAPTGADNARFKFDGILITADNGTNANSASFIGTPQDITFNDITVLYFRATTNSLSGTLPSTEQSALAETVHGDAQTVNRTLHTTKGTTQTSITTTTNAVATAQNLYVTKFVSWDKLSVTSIPAMNWGYSFAVAEPNASANYPVTSTNKAVYVNCYVWKTSNGTLTGTILDGNALASYDEPGSINTEWSENGVFTGAAVTGITPGDDVLVFEVWFQVTQGNATARADLFYYDGTVINNETGLTVSDSASCLIASSALTFGVTTQNITKSLTETVTLSQTLARLGAKNRADTETVTISTTVVRVRGKSRTLTETVTLSQSIARLAAKTRAITTTITLSQTLARLKGVNKPLTETVTLSSTVARLKGAIKPLTETVTVSATLTRIKGAVKALTETVTLSQSIARLAAKTRSLTDTVAVSSTVVRIRGVVRTLTETVTVADSIVRLAAKIRTLGDTLTVSSTSTKQAAKSRSLTETVSLSSTVARMKGAVKSLTETVTISSTVSRLAAKIRTLTDTITIGESLSFAKSGIQHIVKALTETVTISDSLTNARAKIRAITETTSVTATLSRLSAKSRALSPESVTIAPGTVTKQRGLSRTLSDTLTSITTLSRLTQKFRALSDSIAIIDQLARLSSTEAGQKKPQPAPSQSILAQEIRHAIPLNAKALQRFLLETVHIRDSVVLDVRRYSKAIRTGRVKKLIRILDLVKLVDDTYNRSR
jgi:hypothetical protein